MGDVLDLGCGYGPIAVALARRAPGARVWALDVNERAVALCAENAVANGADTVRPVVVDEGGAPLAGAPDDVAALPDGAVRGHLVEPADPHRQGRPAPAPHHLARPAGPRGRRRGWSCNATSAPTPWRRGWRARAGPPSASCPGPATASSRCRPDDRPSRPGDEPEAARNLGGTELKRLHRDWRRRTDQRLGLLLDGVQNPFNVGAILRTAAAFSVDHLWLVGAPSPTDAKVQKTALGSQRFCTWTDHETSAEAAAAARAAGYRIIGVELAVGRHPAARARPPRSGVPRRGPRGPRPLQGAPGACDELGYVPQLGRIGSLNVSTATAIACYEARRSAWTASPDPTP